VVYLTLTVKAALTINAPPVKLGFMSKTDFADLVIDCVMSAVVPQFAKFAIQVDHTLMQTKNASA
jgi:hypothetical protein